MEKYQVIISSAEKNAGQTVRVLYAGWGIVSRDGGSEELTFDQRPE